MTLAAVSDSELLHQRVHFWNDVHGFKMTAMTKGLMDEAYTEGLSAKAVVTDVANIYVSLDNPCTSLNLEMLTSKLDLFRTSRSTFYPRSNLLSDQTSHFDASVRQIFTAS
jgi:hypothetical protein